MEQSARKIQLAVLTAGGLAALVLAAASFFSPFARRLAAGRDVELVLLSPTRPMLYIYHPFSRTVNAVQLPARSFAGAKGRGSAYQRAAEALKLLPQPDGGEPEQPLYIEIKEPDTEAFESLLNGWRARPARLAEFFRAIRRLEKEQATNLSGYEAFLAALELVRLNSSNFIKEDLDRNAAAANAVPEPAAAAAPAAPAVVRLEVLNASGRKDLAVRAAKFLRKKGFDVISFGTYGGVERHTKIVNCSGNLEAALQAREALGLGGLEIYSKPSKLGIADARIILAQDFDEGVLKGIK